MNTEYFKKVQPTYLEAWPRELCALSIAQIDIPLSITEAIALGSNIIEFGEAFGKVQPIDNIIRQTQQAVQSFPNGAFIRLGSRSPKDSWEIFKHGLKITTNDTNPLVLMLGTSERTYEDLQLAIHNNYCPHIFVRQWLDIPKWSEFRCFMRNRKLIGISQYYYDQKFDEIIDNHDTIQWAINNFFKSFKNMSHLDDIVFDIVVLLQANKNNRVWEIKLLETNPLFEMTDPCLFDWRNNWSDFNGEFRYNQ